MSIHIQYRTTRDCDYDDKEVEERLAYFVERKPNALGVLVELLIDAGALDLDQVYTAFRTIGDRRDSVTRI